MVFVGAILILGAFVLAGAVPLYHPVHGILLEAAPYIATLIVGSGMILLDGILRIVNEMLLRRDAQVQTNAYYEELAKARAAREKGQTEGLEAIKQEVEAIKRGQGDGSGERPGGPRRDVRALVAELLGHVRGARGRSVM